LRRHRDAIDVSCDAIDVTVNGGTKNDYRIRTIPLNPVTLDSMRWIVKRWEKLGGTEADRYILPHRVAQRPAEKRIGQGPSAPRAPNFNEPMGDGPHLQRRRERS